MALVRPFSLRPSAFVLQASSFRIFLSKKTGPSGNQAAMNASITREKGQRSFCQHSLVKRTYLYSRAFRHDYHSTRHYTIIQHIRQYRSTSANFWGWAFQLCRQHEFCPKLSATIASFWFQRQFNC